jgi:hypothetical protein
MVVFVVVIECMVMLVTGMTGGVMVDFIFVAGDMVTGVTGGAIVVACFVVGDVLILVMRR